jgi:hypothetical protein
MKGPLQKFSFLFDKKHIVNVMVSVDILSAVDCVLNTGRVSICSLSVM